MAVAAPFLVFSNVSPQTFEAFYNALNGRGRATYFGSKSSLLLVKMPATVHEAVKITLADHLKNQEDQMGLTFPELYGIGSARYNSIHPDGGSKEPDHGLVPGRLYDVPDPFPSLVVEIANAQSITQARMAKDWWFENSDPTPQARWRQGCVPRQSRQRQHRHHFRRTVVPREERPQDRYRPA